MFQRIGIDQHSTLNKTRRRARRNAVHVLSIGKKETLLVAYIYSHRTEKKFFALSFEPIKDVTLEVLNLVCADKLHFTRIDGQVYEIVDGKEILLGNFPVRVSCSHPSVLENTVVQFRR